MAPCSHDRCLLQFPLWLRADRPDATTCRDLLPAATLILRKIADSTELREYQLSWRLDYGNAEQSGQLLFGNQ
ncbi:hypothetical protein [Rubidibacter lacunae]|uniref:hypothetical protein n=1 Tax=Rubidibacter lacunae TaxID=582514 RepID=UPI000420BAB8|nr:hypothetical protein [Rubidibacter lacunae]